MFSSFFHKGFSSIYRIYRFNNFKLLKDFEKIIQKIKSNKEYTFVSIGDFLCLLAI